MKTLSAIAAGTIIAFLLVAPTLVFAATITVGTDKASYSGTSAITYSGTDSALPSGENAVITVKNPTGVVVDTASVPISSTTGAFSYASVTGGTANWVTGTYSVTAVCPEGTASATFSYTGTGAPSGGAAANTLLISTAGGAGNLFPGMTVTLAAYVAFAANGTAPSSTTWTIAQYWGPGATTPTSLPAASNPSRGVYVWSWALAAAAANGNYIVQLQAQSGGLYGQAVTSFSVNALVGTAAAQTANAANVATILANQATAQTSLSAISTAVGGLSTSIASILTSTTANGQTLLTVLSNQATVGTSLTAIQNSITSLSTSVSGISPQLA